MILPETFCFLGTLFVAPTGRTFSFRVPLFTGPQSTADAPGGPHGVGGGTGQPYCVHPGGGTPGIVGNSSAVLTRSGRLVSLNVARLNHYDALLPLWVRT